MSYNVVQKVRDNYYLYEVTAEWDPEKKRSRQKRKYIGKCDKDGDLPSLLNSKDLTAAVASSSAPYSVAHYFYCYPNPATAGKAGSARCTRLVVEASINGKLCYYPISISDIKNNHTYNISELVITRIGSENPDTPVSYSQATFTVTVNSWEEGSDTSVTI